MLYIKPNLNPCSFPVFNIIIVSHDGLESTVEAESGI